MGFLGLEEAIDFCNFEESERICLGNFFGLEEANVYCNFVKSIPNFHSRDGRRGNHKVEKQDGVRLQCSRRCCRANPWDKSIAVVCAADTQ